MVLLGQSLHQNSHSQKITKILLFIVKNKNIMCMNINQKVIPLFLKYTDKP